MNVKIRLVRGLAGKPKKIIDTAHSLGLTKRGREKELTKLDRAIYGKLKILKDYIEIIQQ
ncbi:MAG: uL30 family ribosomal protein [Deltaproteobacteria bacterium]|nr:uL30 family ribosomal protein [Deltaproteobacteria bacterium]